jgi:hypothetical protein
MAFEVGQTVVVEEPGLTWWATVVAPGSGGAGGTCTVEPCTLPGHVTILSRFVRPVSTAEVRAATRIQDFYRQQRAYSTLVTSGTIWDQLRNDINTSQTRSGDPKPPAEYMAVRALSRWNLYQMLQDIRTLGGDLTPGERAFVTALLGEEWFLSHYTSAATRNLIELQAARRLISFEILKKINPGGFANYTSPQDEAYLANTDFVFFFLDPWAPLDRGRGRPAQTRFGNDGETRYVFPVQQTPLDRYGLIMHRDLLDPKWPADRHGLIAKGFVPGGVTNSLGVAKVELSYPMNGGLRRPFDPVDEIFYGPDILLSFGLSAVREFRRMGRTQPWVVQALAARGKALRDVFCTLFRPQVMLPGALTVGFPTDPRESNTLDGATVVPISGDGNCLFAAVAHGLGRRDTAETLRRRAVDYMRANPGRYDGFGVDDAYLTRMALPGTWGGNPELHALASTLGRVIVVHQPGRQAIVIRGDAGNEGDPIHVRYSNVSFSGGTAQGNHYDALVYPKEKRFKWLRKLFS